MNEGIRCFAMVTGNIYRIKWFHILNIVSRYLNQSDSKLGKLSGNKIQLHFFYPCFCGFENCKR